MIASDVCTHGRLGTVVRNPKNVSNQPVASVDDSASWSSQRDSVALDCYPGFTMSDVCQLEMTQSEYDRVKLCESVIVREYERADGSRFAKAVAWGDADEMEEQAEMPSLHIVPAGVSIICQRAVPVSELLG